MSSDLEKACKKLGVKPEIRWAVGANSCLCYESRYEASCIKWADEHPHYVKERGYSVYSFEIYPTGFAALEAIKGKLVDEGDIAIGIVYKDGIWTVNIHRRRKQKPAITPYFLIATAYAFTELNALVAACMKAFVEEKP